LVNTTLSVSQVRTTNKSHIKNLTEYALFQNFSNLQVSPLNVQAPIARLSALLM